MRAVVGIACLLLGLGMFSCRWEGLAGRPAEGARAVRWVRTVDGWERPDSWQVSVRRPPGLHPLVLAAGQGLLSVLGLAAFSGNGRRGAGK